MSSTEPFYISLSLMGALKPKLFEESGKLGMCLYCQSLLSSSCPEATVRRHGRKGNNVGLKKQQFGVIEQPCSPHPFKATTFQMS